MFDNTPITIIDTETTSLDRDNLVVWDVGIVHRPAPGIYESRQYFVEVTTRELDRADQEALDIGGFDLRYNELEAFSKQAVAHIVHDLTEGAILANASVDFDAFGLTQLLKHAHLTPSWHYRLLDIRTIGLGYLLGRGAFAASEDFPDNPGFNDVAEWLGMDPQPVETKHTALGDAEYAASVLREILGE